MNFVIAAYAIIWLFFFGYILKIGKSISKLEEEVLKLKK
ncbi:hypothetical protein MNBD_NITROSPINAE04-2055 [hydrothermal vent metagenome]|uniref:CcmD family protein n=1 Tax=hydrothermal vent metagenome TaxID=652676 RepID=A0A3B1BLI0_9ZZZZ